MRASTIVFAYVQHAEGASVAICEHSWFGTAGKPFASVRSDMRSTPRGWLSPGRRGRGWTMPGLRMGAADKNRKSCGDPY
jgi:hypothetical protein